MKQTDYTGIIPEQYTGKEIEAEASIELNNESEAKTFYEIVKQRLLHVNNWHKLTGISSAKFKLINKEGEEVSRNAEKGDYLKIDIPGPGSKEGDGYDWVRIEELQDVIAEDHESVGFRVRPAKNPFGSNDQTAHFYSEESTSNFIVKREKCRITAWIVDRNIKPNDQAESVIDKIRDTSVGIGAKSIFSKIQWQNLADGLIKTDK
jgi:hypothetical protein